jgi:hypothetical protein
MLRNTVDRSRNRGFGLALRFTVSRTAEARGGQEGPRPRAKILRREISAGRVTQVRVDVCRRNGARDTRGVDVLKQILPRQILAALDDTSEPGVVQHDIVSLAALSDESESHFGAANACMTVAQGREAV